MARARRTSVAVVALGAAALALLLLAGCGSSASAGAHAATATTAAVGSTPGGADSNASATPKPHPQVIEPSVGDQAAVASGGTDPVGDPNAHAVPLSEVRRELKIVKELNSLNPGQGFVFPIQPRSV